MLVFVEPLSLNSISRCQHHNTSLLHLHGNLELWIQYYKSCVCMHTSLYPTNTDMLVLCVCGLRVRVQFASPVQLPPCNDTWMTTIEFQGESGCSLGGAELALCLLVNAQDSGYLKPTQSPIQTWELLGSYPWIWSLEPWEWSSPEM